jgi:hypothetical protein
LLASDSSGRVRWYENDGVLGFSERILEGALASAATVRAADYDGDGDVDIIASVFQEVMLFENDGEQHFEAHRVAGIGGALAVADMDGNGRLDVILGARNGDKLWAGVVFDYRSPRVARRDDIDGEGGRGAGHYLVGHPRGGCEPSGRVLVRRYRHGDA